jgi:hypothetical protein
MVQHVERKAILLQIHNLTQKYLLHSLHLFPVVRHGIGRPVCGDWIIPSVSVKSIFRLPVEVAIINISPDPLRQSGVHQFGYTRLVWRSKAVIILQLRYNNDILTVTCMSILKIVRSYLLFVMSILNTLCHNSAQFCFTLCQY